MEIEQEAAAVAEAVAAEVVKAEAEWADRLPQVRVETVYARTVEQRQLMLPVSLVIKKYVRNVEQK
jgi:hypothetical protein